MSRPALYRLVAQDGARFVAGFGGQGTLTYWQELQELLQDEDTRPVILRTLRAMSERAGDMGLGPEEAKAAFPEGFDLVEWCGCGRG